MTDAPAAFAADYDFALDPFQTEATAALEAGRSVLVAAPTGSGKTIVGEFATWAALRDGDKCFYTTPIKALSNQKFADLSRRYGADRVGLLTGDRSVNGEAPVVVMTTEVLRNMLYVQSPTLRGLRAVVLDEVHYLADRQRGAVWEEVIIQLAASVQLACLSATVSNAEEFGDWLAHVRDGCDVVISEDRPVPLDHHYAIGDRLHPMFLGRRSRSAASSAEPGSAAHDRRRGRGGSRGRSRGDVPNPEVVMLERRARSQRRSRGRRGGYAGVRLRPPRRSELVELLARRRWLPAIVFVFSRAGCDRAVQQVLGDGVRLTDADERRQIRALCRELTADTSAADLDALGFRWFSRALEQGIASHHAGMVPVLKELVETLFVRGLVKVCFATETLALGINMPARTVVIEQLEKWDGQQHQLLTPGQFTQLTGRAGRRGLDTRGHAVVAYQRDIDFTTVASLVGRRVERLRSSFTPTYNMAVNLLRRRTLDEAEQLLAQSFAQYQANQGVATLTARIDRNRAAIAGHTDALQRDDRDRHRRRRDQLAAKTRKLERDVERRTGSLARQLQRIVGVLSDLGYLEGPQGSPEPTDEGLRLAAIYADTDLLLAECVRAGELDDVAGADLAALASVFVHETRAKEPPEVRFPSATVAERFDRIEQRWLGLAETEEQAGLTPTAPPDPGLCPLIWRWAAGADLDDVLAGTDVSGGDFVRGVKQAADLCQQLAAAYGGTPLARHARHVADALVRDLVAAA